MSITEPFGFSLPDRINSIAQYYKIPNWQRAKYFIEVWFTGYNEDGTPVGTNLYYKIFCVTITEMSLGGTETGATYEIKGLIDGMQAADNSVTMPPGKNNAQGITVKEIFQSLEDSLNKNAQKLAMGTAPLLKYKFVTPTFMDNWNLDPGQVIDKDTSAKSMKPSKDGKKVIIEMNQGTEIGAVVNYILSLSNEGDAWAKGEDSSGNTAGLATHGISKNIKLYSRVKYVGYDLKAGDYVREITFYLMPYEEVRVRSDVPTVRTAEKANVQQNKIGYLAGKNRIKKKYEWIYTGNNLDIIRFDFKINNFWTISTVPFAGLNTASNQVQGPVANDTTSSWAQRLGQYKTTTANGLKLGTLEIMRDSAKDTLQAANDSHWLPRLGGIIDYSDVNKAEAALAAAQAELDAQKAIVDKELLKIYNDEFVISFTGDPISAAAAKNPLFKAIDSGNKLLTATFNKNAIYAEDQHINEVDTTFPFVNTVKPGMEANQSNTNQGAASGKIPNTSADPIAIPKSRTLFGAVVGNSESVNKEMMNIILEIRGDPYWMGHSNVEQNPNVPESLSQLDKDYAEFLSGDNMFYLRFRSGQAPNEDTGYMEFTTDNQFVNGYYAITEVTNTFQAGQFTQSLKSFKDTLSQHANATAEKSFVGVKQTRDAQIAADAAKKNSTLLEKGASFVGDAAGSVASGATAVVNVTTQLSGNRP